MVKVIDFGIAKATSQQLTEKTLFTSFNQWLGTPLYMSPEQAQMSGLDVDTLSDVYSLGVLLYVLLTRTTPFEQERLKEANFDEIRHIIREDEPARPSTRVSTLARTSTTSESISRNDFRRLSQLLRGELDWIVMKALEKDRNRRYESAGSFAADVQRYLQDEIVEARPPSRLYRFWKFSRRHTGSLVTGFIVAAALVVGVAVSSYFAFEAGDRAEALHKGLDDLKAADRLLEDGRFAQDGLRWDDANSAYGDAIARSPEYPRPWRARGDLYASLGIRDLAAQDLSRAFELREPDECSRWLLVAQLRLENGDTEGYLSLCSRMFRRFRGTLHNEDEMFLVRTLMLRANTPYDAATLSDAARGIAEIHHWVPYFWYVVGLAEFRAGRDERAVEALNRSYDRGVEWGQRALNLPVLALAHHRLGHAREADESLKEAAKAIDGWIEKMYRVERDPRWAIHQGAQPDWPLGWQDWLEIRALYREAFIVIHGSLPPEDYRPQVLRARAFAGLRRRKDADQVYTAVLMKRPDDAEIRLETYRNRAYLAGDSRRWAEAATEFGRACELKPDDARLWSFRAISELVADNIEAYRRSCKVMFERFRGTSDSYAAHHVVVACILRGDSLPDMAALIPLARVASRLHYGNASILGEALYRAGRYEEALGKLQEADRLVRLNPSDLSFMAMTQFRLGRRADAEQTLRRVQEWMIDPDRRPPSDAITPVRCLDGLTDQFEFQLMFSEAKSVVGATAPQ